MADRIWLKSYPAGIPAEIDADLFASVPDLLETIFRRNSPTSRPITISAAP